MNKCTLAVGLFVVFSIVHAQQLNWTQVYFNRTLQTKWNFNTDAGIRYKGQHYYQYLIRSSANFEISKKLKIGFGLGQFNSINQSEIRLFQDIFYKIRHTLLRFRVEEQYFFEKRKPRNAAEEFRIRLFAGREIPVNKVLALELNSELFHSIRTNRLAWRIGGGLSYRPSIWTKFTINYCIQETNKTNTPILWIKIHFNSFQRAK